MNDCPKEQNPAYDHLQFFFIGNNMEMFIAMIWITLVTISYQLLQIIIILRGKD